MYSGVGYVGVLVWYIFDAGMERYFLTSIPAKSITIDPPRVCALLGHIVFFNALGRWKIYMMIEESEVSMGGVCDGMRNK